MVRGKANDRRDEAVALPLCARNVLVTELTVAQCLAQRRQMDAKAAFLDRYVRPCPRNQLGFPDNFTGVFEKRNQDVIGPATKWNDLVRLFESALGDIPALALSLSDAARLRQGQPVLLRGRDAPIFTGTAYATSRGMLVAVGEMEAGEFRPKRIFNFPR